MLKKLSLTLAVLAAGLAAAVASRPAAWRVERAATVAASPAVVRLLLVDPQRWPAWWPGPLADREVQRRFGGPLTGVGASLYWSGAGSTGQGRLTVTAETPRAVELELEAEGPAAAASDSELELVARGTGTRITWSMSGEDGLLRRALSLVWSRRAELDPLLDRGLARLGAAAASAARVETRRVARAVVVAAPRAAVLAQLVDPRRWGAFSPWAAEQSALWSFGGPSTGVGASGYWSAGAPGARGRLTVVDVGEARVDLEHEVTSPEAAASDHQFLLAEEGSGTRVTWAVSIDDDPDDPSLGGVVPTADALGRDLDRGLSKLKAVVEAAGLATP